jgi:hypothetical protein
MDKLNEYQGFVGRLHSAREDLKSTWERWKDSRNQPPALITKDQIEEQYGHIFRYS